MKNRKIFSYSSIISIIYILFLIILAIIASFTIDQKLLSPSEAPLVAPNFKHWFGTDDLGIDIFAQISSGTIISLKISFFSALFSLILSLFFGISSGYYGGIWDKLVLTFCDVMMSLPQLPVIIVLSVLLEPNIKNMVIIITLFSFVIPTKTIRAKILFLKEEKYIINAKHYGGNLIYISLNHFFPILFPIITINIIKIISKSIIMESSLAFLGLGDPLSKSWGMIINRALSFQGIYYTEFWKWWLIVPVIFLTLLIISFSLISRDLEKYFNTKL